MTLRAWEAPGRRGCQHSLRWAAGRAAPAPVRAKRLQGYATVNAFANYEIAKGVVLSLGLNKLFNTLGYSEAEGQNKLGNNALYIARAVNGRSAKLSLKYSF